MSGIFLIQISTKTEENIRISKELVAVFVKGTFLYTSMKSMKRTFT